jgi:hypothetical protein
MSAVPLAPDSMPAPPPAHELVAELAEFEAAYDKWMDCLLKVDWLKAGNAPWEVLHQARKNLVRAKADIDQLAYAGMNPTNTHALEFTKQSEEVAHRAITKARSAPPRYAGPITAQAYSTARRSLSWLIKHVLPAQGIGAIYAPFSAGKSFLALDAAGAIAQGRPQWFGHKVKTAHPVCYVPLEGHAGIKDRLDAYASVHGWPDKLFVHHTALDLRLAASVAPFVDSLRGIAPALVIVDTLNAAMPGGDENSAQDMGAAIAGLKAIQAALGCLVLVVHHTGKDTSKGLRGHSSLGAALDVVIEIERQAGSPVRSWRSDKQKDGAESNPLNFSLRVVALKPDEDGDAISSCVIEPTSALVANLAQLGRRQKLGDRQKEALKELTQAVANAPVLPMDGLGAEIPKGFKSMAKQNAISVVKGGLSAEGKASKAANMIDSLRDAGYVGYSGDWLWIK